MNRTTTVALVAVLMVTATATLAIGGAADGTPQLNAQETETATEAETTAATETTAGDAGNATVENLTVETLTLKNVTLLNATVKQASLPDQNASNIHAEQMVVTATMRNVTLEGVTVRNESLAEALGLAGGDANATAENLTLTNRTISGLAIGNGTIEDTANLRVKLTAREVDVNATGPVALEIDRATVSSVTIDDLTIVNLQSGGDTSAGTTTGETTEEDEQA